MSRSEEIGVQVDQSSAIVGRAACWRRDPQYHRSAERTGRTHRQFAVADMIGEIASRTNLLALNATIERREAGGSWRGLRRGGLGGQGVGHRKTAYSTQEIAEHIGQH